MIFRVAGGHRDDMALKGEVGFYKNELLAVESALRKTEKESNYTWETWKDNEWEIAESDFSTESGMISRTSETSETTVLIWKRAHATSSACLQLSPLQVRCLRNELHHPFVISTNKAKSSRQEHAKVPSESKEPWISSQAGLGWGLESF